MYVHPGGKTMIITMMMMITTSTHLLKLEQTINTTDVSSRMMPCDMTETKSVLDAVRWSGIGMPFSHYKFKMTLTDLSVDHVGRNIAEWLTLDLKLSVLVHRYVGVHLLRNESFRAARLANRRIRLR